MTDTWETTLAHTITAFNGETPGPDLEVEIQAAYTTNGPRVRKAIDRTAALVAAGKINSGWAVLRAELRKHHTERQRKVQEFSDEQQLANLEIAEAEAEERAATFRQHFRCQDCGKVKLPWWLKCMTTKCVTRRRHTEPEAT